MDKKKIYKYPLEIGKTTSVKVPPKAIFLSAKPQKGNIVAYFLVDAYTNKEEYDEHEFFIIGTGSSFELDENMLYLDTLLMHADGFVLHIFKKR